MFSLLARMLYKLSSKPWIVLTATVIISLLCIYPASNLRWDLQLSDLLLESPRKAEKLPQGLEAKLPIPVSLVVEGTDSAGTRKFVEGLVKRLDASPLVNFSAYEIDLDFYKKNHLLYASEEELNELYERLLQTKDLIAIKSNPFIVELDEETEFKVSEPDFSQKLKFPNVFQSKDGTVRVIDVFPNINVAKLDSARQFVAFIRETVGKMGADSIKVSYAGNVTQVLQTGRTLLPEAVKAGKFTACLIGVLLLIAFLRQPQLIVPTGISILLSVYWTFGLAYFIYGRICLFSILLAAVLPGLAAQHVTHIFRRYSRERSRGLNSELSLESALLGIAPVAAASATATAAIFFSLTFVPLEGLRELGVLGAIGAILNWILCATFTPAILRLLFRTKHRLFLFGGTHPEKLQRRPTKLSGNTRIFIAILVIATILLASRGVYPQFHYNFGETEMVTTSHSDSLLKALDHQIEDPVIIAFPAENAAQAFIASYEEGKGEGKFATINHIYTWYDLLPSNQRYKLQIIENIRELLKNPMFQFLPSKDSLKLEALKQSLQVSLITEDDLPKSFRQFLDLQEGTGIYAFILPSQNADDGLFCRRLVRDLETLSGEDPCEMFGVAVVRANVLDKVLQHTFKSILFSAFAVLVILLLFYNKLSYAIFILAAPALAFLWLLSSLRLFGVELSVYSALAFPLLIGMSLDGSLHFWNYYFVKRGGSATDVVRKHGLNLTISQVSTLVCFYGLVISSHPGLRSIGQIAIWGLVCITVADFFMFRILASLLDAYRLNKLRKRERRGR